MNLTGLLPVPTPADAGASGAQTALPGFPDLVAALLSGSDVVSPEVLGEDPGSRPGAGGGLADSAGDEIGNRGDPDQAGIALVHPLLVAEAILRHPDLGSTGTAPDPTAPVSLSSDPQASGRLVATAGEPAVGSGMSAGGIEPSGEGTVGKPGSMSGDATHTTPSPEGLEIASQAVRAEAPAHGLRERPSESTSDSTAAGAAQEPKPPAKASGPEPVLPAAIPVEPSGSQPEIASDLETVVAEVADPDRRTGSEEVSRDAIDHRRAESAQAHAVPPTPERSTEPSRLLSAAAHRVEQAIRRLENAPPPNVVTFTIEELDLRLTVALRPDGIHLSSPGHQTDAGLIRSLENALAARGFDLAQGDRGRREHERPEAPWRPTTQPTRTRRTSTAETRL